MPPPVIVNVDCAFLSNPGYQYEQARFASIPAELRLTPARMEEEIVSACAGADVILLEYAGTPITERVIANLPRCRAMVKYGIGVDNIDIAAATKHRIVICNAAAFCVEEVSDHALALLLAAARRVVAMDRNIRSGGWFDFPQANSVRRLRMLTVGLIGFGRVAQAVARKLQGWGMPILAFDPFAPTAPAGPHVRTVALDELLRTSDLISIHVPLTADSRGMIGEAELRRMKNSAIVVNTSRGPVIDETSLVKALQEEWIACAALDVFDSEPLAADHALLSLKNTILTPHYAGRSEDSMAELKRTVADSVEAVVKGFWPPFPVNPQVAPRVPLRPWQEFQLSTDAR